MLHKTPVGIPDLSYRVIGQIKMTYCFTLCAGDANPLILNLVPDPGGDRSMIETGILLFAYRGFPLPAFLSEGFPESLVSVFVALPSFGHSPNPDPGN